GGQARPIRPIRPTRPTPTHPPSLARVLSRRDLRRASPTSPTYPTHATDPTHPTHPPSLARLIPPRATAGKPDQSDPPDLRDLGDFDIHAAVLDDSPVRFHGHHARPLHDVAGADVEHALVEVALDQVPVDEALGQRAGTVRAVVVGHAKLAVEVEDRERQTGCFDPACFSRSDVLNPAQFDSRRRGAHTTGS